MQGHLAARAGLIVCERKEAGSEYLERGSSTVCSLVGQPRGLSLSTLGLKALSEMPVHSVYAHALKTGGMRTQYAEASPTYSTHQWQQPNTFRLADFNESSCAIARHVSHCTTRMHCAVIVPP